jgi:serine/threonine protein kinase/tetratricopeptide (TPR) repeat protein
MPDLESTTPDVGETTTANLGSIVGKRYQLVAELGRGGFGITYLAKIIDSQEESLCVVKQLQPRFIDDKVWENAKDRFLTEALILQKLGHHPQIPRSIDYFEEDRGFYLVQEYVEGKELGHDIPDSAWDENQIVWLLRDVLEVLDFVHQQGVIHRDIKPSNLIRRQSDRRIVVIDFGAVKELGSVSVNSQGQTIYTQTIGTHGYMAPEQIIGKPTFASDIYALGRTAIAALTARSPLDLEDLHTGELAKWKELAPVNQKLASILDKMTRPKYSDRYHSTAEVLEDLEPLLKLETIIGGRYKLICYLGGGTGDYTYLAENLHRQYQSPCIIKKINPQGEQTTILQQAENRFTRELTLLEKLGSHPQIPKLWDHFVENRNFYLVQEFVEGEDLAKELNGCRRLIEGQVIELLKDVLEVLSFIHKNGIIHRDIKPSNLLRRKTDGRIVTIDFGIIKELANIFHDRPEMRRSTRSIGTEGYMPPEQTAGRPTYSSDIYALGMTAIHALTGVMPDLLPVDLKTGEVLWQQKASVNPKLAKILDRTIAIDLSKRYDSADKVLSDLGRIGNTSISANSNTNSNTSPHPTNPCSNNYNAKTVLSALESPVTKIVAAWQVRRRWQYVGAGVLGVGAIWLGVNLFGARLQPVYDLQQANKSIVEKPKEALSLFEQLLAKQPDNAGAWLGKGDALVNLDRFPDALSAYDRALNIEPNNLEFLNRKGRILHRLERYKEALEIHERLVRAEPQNPEFLSDRGTSLISMRRYQEALVDLQRAQTIKPREPQLWQNKAIALKYLGRLPEAASVNQEALDAYTLLLQSQPQNVNLLLEKAQILRQLQRYDEALSVYDKAIEVQSGSYPAWLGKTLTLSSLNRYDEAIAAIDKATKLRPDSYIAWQTKGIVLRDGKKNYSEAIAAFDRSLSIFPKFYQVWRDRGIALSRWQKYSEAIESFDKALAIDKGDEVSWVGKGLALASLRRCKDSEAAFSKAVGYEPNQSFVWRNRGKAAESCNLSDEALKSYKKADELERSNF